MKKNKRKRPNPAATFEGDIASTVKRAVGPMMLAAAIPDATLTELVVLAALLPTALKVLRSAGKDAAQRALDTMYPEGGEIFPGVHLEPVPANETAGSHSASPEAEKKDVTAGSPAASPEAE